jgi:hypothetical protein
VLLAQINAPVVAVSNAFDSLPRIFDVDRPIDGLVRLLDTAAGTGEVRDIPIP